MTEDFGWELIRHALESNFESTLDVVKAFVHWRLCLRGGLGVVGLGDGLKDDLDITEILPSGWTKNDVKYRKKAKMAEKFVLNSVSVDADSVIASVVRIADEKVATVNIKLSDHFDAESKQIRDLDALAKKIDDEIVHKVVIDVVKEDKKASSSTSDPLRADFPSRGQSRPDFEQPPALHPGIGTGDLDPLMGGGPGMLMEPPGRGRHGRGRFEPNFDPFHPHMPDPARRGRGGGRGYGDDFGPPGFDNMFG